MRSKLIVKAGAVLLILASLWSCSKQKSNSPASPELQYLSGKVWTIYYIEKNSDYYIHPVPLQWTMTLDLQGGFVFTLNNASGTGNYQWNQTDSINAGVQFKIKSWNFLHSDTLYSNRLKDVLLTVQQCVHLTPPHLTYSPTPPYSASEELVFKGTAGSIYVYIP